MTHPDPPNEVSDEARDQRDAAFEGIDEKVILAQILTELQQIRLLLADQNTQGEDEDESRFECKKCGTVVPGGERERHASGEHRSPPGSHDELFQPVE